MSKRPGGSVNERSGTHMTMKDWIGEANSWISVAGNHPVTSHWKFPLIMKGDMAHHYVAE